MTPVPCETTHEYESIAPLWEVDGDHPGDDAMHAMALEHCETAFLSYVGEPAAESDLLLDYLFEPELVWKATGHQLVGCYVPRSRDRVGRRSGVADPVAPGLGVAVVLGLTGALVLRQGRDGGATRHEALARIDSLVDFVESERGLVFHSPVPVEFLADDAFDGVLGEADPVDADLVALWRSLGLVSEAQDLTGDWVVVGLYDWLDRRILVRDDELTLDGEVTFVHELTHALQDQHHTLGRAALDAQAGFAQQALIEGDATRIELAWIDSLSQDSRDVLYASTDESPPWPDASYRG